jgi:RNA:NAD 2'-phosphotransferase (TPT1/KptA family)
MKKSFQIEDAFQKIRAATGHSDVQEIVHKFLTREQTYA